MRCVLGTTAQGQFTTLSGRWSQRDVNGGFRGPAVIRARVFAVTRGHLHYGASRADTSVPPS
jgi:hypothetical protein